MVKKNTVVSPRTTIIPVCDLHLLFSIPFSLMIYGEIMASSGLARYLCGHMPVARFTICGFEHNEKRN